MQELIQDRTVDNMVISERLARRLVGDDVNKWSKVDQRVIPNDDGTKHVCGQAIDVSWRWSADDSTRDSTVYISSKLHARTGDHGNPTPKGVFDFLFLNRVCAPSFHARQLWSQAREVTKTSRTCKQKRRTDQQVKQVTTQLPISPTKRP